MARPKTATKRTTLTHHHALDPVPHPQIIATKTDEIETETPAIEVVVAAVDEVEVEAVAIEMTTVLVAASETTSSPT